MTEDASRGTREPGPPRPRGRAGQLLGRLLHPGRKPGPEEYEALGLRPMTRGMESFSIGVFFLLGVALTTFVLVNPLGVPFLPQNGSGGEQAEKAAAEAGSATESEQLYQCPMHPEVIESEPGECPICGMKLMPIDQGPAARPEQLYQCPMHPEVIESKPGECLICGMDLVPVEQSPAGEEDGRKVLYWYAPMDPTYVRKEPGLSPMGMKLVPKYADEVKGRGSRVVEIDPVQVQNIGVVSVPARRGEIARATRTVGILDFNADLITWVNTKFSGWIEKVHVTYVGQEVREGEPLFEIYSPELVTTQEEYLRALDYKSSLENSDRAGARRQAESLLQSTKERLLYWDISEDQIRELEESGEVKRRLTVFSPSDGVAVEIMDQALEGMFVSPGMNLYEIANLSSLWVHVDVYESDFSWIHKGHPAEVSFKYEGGRSYWGEILFLYPEVSEDTRTLKICVKVPNEDRRLRPGMYADVTLLGPPVEDAVIIPASAVLRSGERNLVFVDLGGGRFEPREATIGVKGRRDEIQVLDGIAPGERVVTQAQFMLDSESRVQEAIAKFMERGAARQPPGAEPRPQTRPSNAPAGHGH